jgi:hypothetical protein
MERFTLMVKLELLDNDDKLELGNDFYVKRSFDRLYFMSGNKVFLDSGLVPHRQAIIKQKWYDQFADYIMQHIN